MQKSSDYSHPQTATGLGSALPVPAELDRAPAQAPAGGSRRSLRAWIILGGTIAASLLLLLAGSPVLSVAILVLLVAWVLRDALFTWTSGIGLLLMVLQFVPSRIYRLPFASAFDLDPYRLGLFALALVWIVLSVARRRVLFTRTYLDAAIIVFLIAAAVSYLINASLFVPPSEFSMMVKSTAFLLSLPLTMYLVASNISDSGEALWLIDLVVASAGIVGVFAIAERLTQYNVFQHLDSFVPGLQYIDAAERLSPIFRGAVRVAGPTAHPIAFATMLAMLLPLAIVRALEGRSKRGRIVSATCAALIGVGIFLALSRTGVVGIATGGVVVLVGLPRRRSLLLWSAAGLLGVVHLVFRGLIGTLIEFFTPSYVLAQEVGNQNGRLSDYALAPQEILNRPFFGRGLNTFSPDRYTFLDNQYLKFVLELGVVGTAAYVFLMFRAVTVPFSAGRRLDGELGAVLIGLAAASAVFAVTSATFDTVGFPQVAYLFFALAGLSAVIVNERVRAGRGSRS